jgi:hypothetical protein
MANRVIQPTPKSTLDKWKNDFMEWAPKNGVSVEWFGKNITTNTNRTFKIIGWDPTARKYAVIGERLGQHIRINIRALRNEMAKG